MRAPQIQFARGRDPVRLIGIAAAVLAAALAGLSAWEYAAKLHVLNQLEADIVGAARLADRRRAAPVSQAAAQIPEPRVNAINSAIARLNIPWSELFAAFETEKAKDIALLALLPDARNRSLVVQAETPSARSMIEFVERLRANASFNEVFLTKHERREQDAGQPYRFTIEIRWREVS